MTEKRIQLALVKNFSSRTYIFTNTYFFKNESDVLTFTAAGMCYEYEVKITKSDFSADFKKLRHKVMTRLLTNPSGRPNVANRFYYVCPSNIIPLSSCPDYAGLIYVDEYGRLKEIKKAPLLHKEKHDVKKLFDKLYFYYLPGMIKSIKDKCKIINL